MCGAVPYKVGKYLPQEVRFDSGIGTPSLRLMSIFLVGRKKKSYGVFCSGEGLPFSAMCGCWGFLQGDLGGPLSYGHVSGFPVESVHSFREGCSIGAFWIKSSLAS